MQTAPNHPITNHLAKERSPYLKSAARQPVQWFPWSPEAFQEARRLERPILLDIGASWCHWCHVMDRESYENGDISKFINEHFIAVKVDRDERPEIDVRYQGVVGALTGQGGWPLTVFLTPQGEAFYGGTYFPPEDRYGQPGFKRLLKRIVGLYQNRKEDILGDAKKIAAVLEKTSQRALSPEETLTNEIVENCLFSLKHHFDFAHGGFGNAPKFYHPNALELALHHYFFTRQSWLGAVIEKTLEAMGKGGVYDQIGGGFHRYSVDEKWIVPHFEKMSYDNASLLRVYAKAYGLFQKSFYREIAMGIIRWVREEMSDAERGGFYASQDADTGPHDDGDYYTWTRREVEALLTKEEARVVLPHFDIEAQGEMHHDPSRNVLFVHREPEILAREMELKPREVIRLLESAKRKLLAARRRRKTPFVDPTLYTNWNGLWIRAFFTASRYLGESSLKDFALRTLNRFRDGGYHGEKGMTRFLDPTANFHEGLLEDQAEILAAAGEAFEISADPAYLEFSKKLAKILFDRFAAEDGGFYDIAHPKEEGHLRIRQRRIQDSPVSSPNSTAAAALLRLYHLTREPEYFERARSLFRYFHAEAKSFSYFAAGYVNVFDFYLQGPVKIVIAGRRTDPIFKELHETALSAFCPHALVVPLDRDNRPPSARDPAFDFLCQEEDRTGHPLALVCAGNACQPFTDNAEELERQIKSVVPPP